MIPFVVECEFFLTSQSRYRKTDTSGMWPTVIHEITFVGICTMRDQCQLLVLAFCKHGFLVRRWSLRISACISIASIFTDSCSNKFPIFEGSPFRMYSVFRWTIDMSTSGSPEFVIVWLLQRRIGNVNVFDLCGAFSLHTLSICPVLCKDVNCCKYSVELEYGFINDRVAGGDQFCGFHHCFLIFKSCFRTGIYSRKRSRASIPTLVPRSKTACWPMLTSSFRSGLNL